MRKMIIIGAAIMALTGCAGLQTTSPESQASYRYDDIAQNHQGQWRGMLSDPTGNRQSTFVVNLQRGVISEIFYNSFDCGGRVKYQRTEGDGSYTYLEQIEKGDLKKCERNSYVKFRPLSHNEMAIGLFNMDGKVKMAGTMHRAK